MNAFDLHGYIQNDHLFVKPGKVSDLELGKGIFAELRKVSQGR